MITSIKEYKRIVESNNNEIEYYSGLVKDDKERLKNATGGEAELILQNIQHNTKMLNKARKAAKELKPSGPSFDIVPKKKYWAKLYSNSGTLSLVTVKKVDGDDITVTYNADPYYYVNPTAKPDYQNITIDRSKIKEEWIDEKALHKEAIKKYKKGDIVKFKPWPHNVKNRPELIGKITSVYPGYSIDDINYDIQFWHIYPKDETENFFMTAKASYEDIIEVLPKDTDLKANGSTWKRKK